MNINQQLIESLQYYINEMGVKKDWNQVIQNIKSSEVLRDDEKSAAIQKAMKAAKRQTYDRDHYQANKKKRAIQQGAYYQANKEKILAQQKKYCQANKEQVANVKRVWYQANKDKRT